MFFLLYSLQCAGALGVVVVLLLNMALLLWLMRPSMPWLVSALGMQYDARGVVYMV